MMLANFERDGIRFAFERRSTGRPMVLLHGLGGDRSGGFDLADTRLRWQRLALDQRGHGDTEPVGPETGYSFEVFASDVLALLDNEDVNAAVVVGVSMGSAVALRLALDHPRRVKGLALVRPAWTHEPLTENLVPNIEVAGLLPEAFALIGVARRVSIVKDLWTDSRCLATRRGVPLFAVSPPTRRGTIGASVSDAAVHALHGSRSAGDGPTADRGDWV